MGTQICAGGGGISPSKQHYGLWWMLQSLLLIVLSGGGSGILAETNNFTKRSISDQSVSGYLTERTCWWNEVCKEEFQSLFRCKCPEWSFCRAPGRYYNAFCSMTATGYIWQQPGLHVVVDDHDNVNGGGGGSTPA